MTSEQCQAFLQARTASRIQAITSGLAQDNVSAVTNGTGIVMIPTGTGGASASQQVAQVSQAQSAGGNSSAATLTPFGGRAAHHP
jgi:hypothetical protein